MNNYKDDFEMLNKSLIIIQTILQMHIEAIMI